MADFLGQSNRRKLFIHCWHISLDRTTEGTCSSTDGKFPWTVQQKEDVYSLIADFLTEEREQKHESSNNSSKAAHGVDGEAPVETRDVGERVVVVAGERQC